MILVTLLYKFGNTVLTLKARRKTKKCAEASSVRRKENDLICDYRSCQRDHNFLTVNDVHQLRFEIQMSKVRALAWLIYGPMIICKYRNLAPLPDPTAVNVDKMVKSTPSTSLPVHTDRLGFNLQGEVLLLCTN